MHEMLLSCEILYKTGHRMRGINFQWSKFSDHSPVFFFWQKSIIPSTLESINIYTQYYDVLKLSDLQKY